MDTTRALLLGIVGCFLLGVWPAAADQTPLYRDPRAPLEARVSDLLGRLTLEEKLSLLGGTGFGTRPIERLGLPAMGMCDGPIGVRGGGPGTSGPATVFPCGIAMAATWDPEIVQRIGAAIGREVQHKGVGAQIILGPCVNLHRTPQGGRNGESFSEDPYLASRMTVAYVTGVQSTGAAACVKHFAVNNQEWQRGTISAQVDERALRELYLPAFQAAVQEAHVWAVMNAYNRLNGTYCSANRYLLTTILKDEWGFDGCVMTDWGAAHSPLGVATGGTDLEMPTGAHMNPDRLTPPVQEGKVSRGLIDDKVRRILRTVIRVGLLDGPKTPDNTVVNCAAHRQLVREAGARAIVLLKNDGGLLPLDPAKLRSLAVIGPNAAVNRLAMGGSGYVTAFQSVSALDTIRARVGPGVTINYAKGADMGDEPPPVIGSEFLTPAGGPDGEHGLRGEYFKGRKLEGRPVLTRTDAVVDFRWQGKPPVEGLGGSDYSVRWTGKLTPTRSGEYRLGVASDDGSRLTLDGKALISNWEDHALEARSVTVRLEAGRAYDLQVEYYQNSGDAAVTLGWRAPGVAPEHDPQIREAVAAAQQSDAAIVLVGLSSFHESEGRDRDSLRLPELQADLIRAVVAANPRTVVVLTNGTPLLMDTWIKQTPAVLEAWYLGEQGGQSVTDVLFGDVNPSGKLPDTLAAKREDYPDWGHYPGGAGQVQYAEGILVGYRHFDARGIAPLFPFGHGLSYTTFAYDDLRVTPETLAPAGTVQVSLTVRNTGPRAGEEVVQLYLHDPRPRVPKAPRELKRFARVALQPGEGKPVTFTLEAPALAYCDVPGKQWRADAGVYQVEVGASSRDLRLRGNLTLSADWTRPIPHLGEWQDAAADLGPDLALGKPVQASSVENEQTRADCAVDGNGDTRWSSQFSDPQWLRVDLGEAATIGRVLLRWETAFASSYVIEVSLDGEQWRQVYATENGAGDEEVVSFAPTPARYVRLTGRKRGTQYGYSLYTLGVYGPKK
ncbi:glycoside hydrolase family 3 C-terminal domain-containing protein [bacterium]|nr:glycoside hydrolase family 3 C-terminal domain-containing protein [bacterium]